MDDAPERPDPSDATKPVPQSIPPAGAPFERTVPPSTSLPDARETSAEYSAAYVHRFGSKPFYLFARFAAFLIDGCGMTFIIATFAFNARTHGSFLSAVRGEGGYVTIVSGAFALAVVFAFACEGLFGTTIGKLVFALHVRTLAGRHVGAGRVLIRTILYPVDLMLVGLLLAATTRRRQRLGDVLAKTVVSNGSIGAFASVIGVAFVIALAYAQAAYAGGVRSVDGFASQTTLYAPRIFTHVISLFRSNEGSLPAVGPSESPTPAMEAASAAPVAPEAEPSAEAPSAQPSSAEAATGAPNAELSTGAPTLASPDSVRAQTASPIDASTNPSEK